MSFFKDKWIEQMSQVLRMNTNLSDKQIVTFLNKKYSSNVKDHECVIYNSYDRETTETTLLGTLDWIQQRKPIVTEAGTFFMRVDENKSLHAQIVQANLEKRNEFKGEMFAFERALDFINASLYDSLQTLEKLRANAPYGVDGNPYSFSNSFAVASSTTFVGRGQTSMAALNFENIVNDHVKFEDMNEMFTYINNIIIKDVHTWQYDTNDIIDIVPSKKDLIDRLVEKFELPNYDIDIITNVVEKMSKEIRTRVYYKSNLRAFLVNEKISDLLEKMMADEDVLLSNPYKPEKEIVEDLNKFSQLVNEFVGYRYQYFRYEDKVRFKKRKTNVIIDTDSCIIHVGGIMSYAMVNCLRLRVYFNKKDYMTYCNKLCNILGASFDLCMKVTIQYYTAKINVDNSMGGIVLKNEFTIGTLGNTKAMKSYYYSMLRKESVVYDKPKTTLKGLTLMKSTATEKASQFIIEEIIKKSILYPKNNKVDLKKITNKSNKFVESMRDEILDGDLKYHKQGVNVKKENGYKDAMTIQQYKATYIWNQLMPKEQIDLPNVVSVIKVDLGKKKDIEKLDVYPKIFERLLDLFENDPHIANSGITAIAIPREYEKIPDWMMDVLAVEDIINENVALFSQIFGALQISELTVNSNTGNNTYYDKFIRI
jgi:hypothetical protein